MGKIFIVLATFFTLAWSTVAEATQPEYRAMWVTRFSLVSSENIIAAVNSAAQNNFNALFVQVCGRGYSFYESAILPKDPRVEDFDPLALLIKEAKKNDIELHAWVNALYVWSDIELPEKPEHIVNKRPEWIQANSQNTYDRNKYLDPGIPAVRDYVKSIYIELAEKYDLAGVHLDYIRYPGNQWGYSKLARQEFERNNEVDPLALIKNRGVAQKLYGAEKYNQLLDQWNSYRADSVQQIVSGIYKELSIKKPNVKLSAAVIANYQYAQKDYFQNWGTWLSEGIIDIVIPMIYDVNNDVVERQIVFATELAEKSERMVLVGLGAWRRQSSEIINNIAYTRKIRNSLGYTELGGVVLFSYEGITVKGDYLQKIKNQAFEAKVTIPPSNFKNSDVADKAPEKTQPPAPQQRPKEQIDYRSLENIIG